MIDVQVERPVTIKANGKTIKLTNEEARELAEKLNAALGVKTFPYVPWYPHTTRDDSIRWDVGDYTYTAGSTTTTPAHVIAVDIS